MPEPDIVLIILVAGSFLAAVCNAAFSAGGALIVLATTSAVLPVAAIVPIHSTLLFGSTMTRAVLFRPHIDWSIAVPFLLASGFGAFIGARVYFELPENVIVIAIACLMLVAIWLPQIRWRPAIRNPWLVVGFVHSLLSTVFAYGAILQAVILHTGLTRHQVIATVGACLTGMGLFKIISYAVNGFDYTKYLVLIGAAVVVSWFGTWLGKKLADRISESLFRSVFRWLITLTALRLIYVGVVSMLR